MTSFRIFTLPTPFGRLTYAHHALDALDDGADGYITDATLDAEDGAEPRSLDLDEVSGLLREWGPARLVWPSNKGTPVELG